MTLILSAYANGHTFQVSDRLLSVFTDAKGYEPVYAYANKSLVVRTLDAVVTIGFSGVAYIRGETTDTWIAKRLLTELKRDGRSYWGLGAMTLPRLVDDLRRSLPSALASSPSTSTFLLRLEIAGQQYDGSQQAFHPVALSMDFVKANGAIVPHVIGHGARTQLRAGVDPQLLFSHPPGPAIARWLDEQFRAGRQRTQEGFESLLVQALRLVAERSPQTVGSDCMLVHVLPNPAGGPVHIDVEFLPASPKRGTAVSGQGVSFPLAFTPGLLCPGGYMMPAVQNVDAGIHPYMWMNVKGLPESEGLPFLAYRGDLVPPKQHQLWKWRDLRPRLPGVD